MPAAPLVIGVDGGGTKTVAWLAPLDGGGVGTFLGRGRAGPGNPRAAGFEAALANIELAIAAAFADAGLPQTTAAAACFGLAGAGRKTEQERIAAWALQEQLAHQVRVTGDAEPILAAASPENWGIALIIGTGSLAWGRNQAGETARCGGWGYLLGDNGSAYAIALAGLQSAMRAADGRGPATSLLSHFQQELQAATPPDLIDRVYGPEMTRERLANLAQIVFQAADSDAVARSIISRAAEELTEIVAVLRSRLGFAAGQYALAIAGSVGLHQPAFVAMILDNLKRAGAEPESVATVAEPVVGAVALARLSAQERGRTRP